MPLRKTKKTSAEIIRKAYKFQVVPTEEQKVMFAQTFGCVVICTTECLMTSQKHISILVRI